MPNSSATSGWMVMMSICIGASVPYGLGSGQRARRVRVSGPRMKVPRRGKAVRNRGFALRLDPVLGAGPWCLVPCSRLSAPDGAARSWSAFASQTGAAERIAWRSANALAAAALSGWRRWAALTAADIAEAGTLLVVTSTYGAGEAPDSARAPLSRSRWRRRPDFKGLRFAVLALGDRKYDATFCGFGKRLDRWLAAGKAKRLFDIVCVDGDDDDAAMTRWARASEPAGRETTRRGADARRAAGLAPGGAAAAECRQPRRRGLAHRADAERPGAAGLDRRRHRRNLAAQSAQPRSMLSWRAMSSMAS